jgi:hypothetical protein
MKTLLILSTGVIIGVLICLSIISVLASENNPYHSFVTSYSFAPEGRADKNMVVIYDEKQKVDCYIYFNSISCIQK